MPTKLAAVTVALVLVGSGPAARAEPVALTDRQLDAVTAGLAASTPVTPATTYHGLPGNNPGHGAGNASASPNGTGKNGGGGIHGIANVPGQAGINPNDDGTRGFANQLNTVHGGIGAANKNVDD